MLSAIMKSFVKEHPKQESNQSCKMTITVVTLLLLSPILFSEVGWDCRNKCKSQPCSAFQASCYHIMRILAPSFDLYLQGDAYRAADRRDAAYKGVGGKVLSLLGRRIGRKAMAQCWCCLYVVWNRCGWSSHNQAYTGTTKQTLMCGSGIANHAVKSWT